MNTKAPHWIDYIKFYTTPAPALAVVPKAQEVAPVQPAIMVARYLGTRRVDKSDGSHVIRDMWSHKTFEFVGYIGTEYARIQDRYGVLTLPRSQVDGLPVMTETKAA